MEKNVSILQLIATASSLTLIITAAIINFHVKVSNNVKDIEYLRQDVNDVEDDYRVIDEKLDQILVKLEQKADRE